jgi:iron(III) transport system substrate-binding protein
MADILRFASANGELFDGKRSPMKRGLMSRRTPVLLAAFGVLFALGVAACGAQATATPTSAPATPTATTAAGSTPVASPTPTSKPAWEAEWDALVAAAEAEGQFVMTVFSATDRAAVEKFKTVFPKINTEVQILSGRDFVARVPEEMRAGVYSFDVYMGGSTTAATQLVPLGTVLDDTRAALFRPDVIEGSNWVGGDFDDYWADDANDTRKYIANGPASAGGAGTFRVNTQVAPNLDTVDDWFDPAFRGKICLEDPRTLGGGDTFFATVMMFRGNDFVRRLLTETQPRISRDLRQIASDVVRGDCVLSVGGTYTEFEAQGLTSHIREYSLDLGTVTPEWEDKVTIVCCGTGKNKTVIEDHMSAGAGGPALLQGARHPNAAKLFLNWWLSKEGQQSWLEQQSKITVDGTQYPNNCVGRVDLQQMCVPSKRPRADGAYFSYQYASNITLRDTGRNLVTEILGR